MRYRTMGMETPDTDSSRWLTSSTTTSITITDGPCSGADLEIGA